MRNDQKLFVVNREEALRDSLELRRNPIPERISADPGAVESGLPKLVLSIIELIRQLLERQALRRMDAGNLTDTEVEQLGQALMKLEEKMEQLKDTFGLSDEDLELSLGPVQTLE